MIVIGYDGSEGARRAVAVAGALFSGPAVVVHVWSSLPAEATPLAGPGAIAVPAPAPKESEDELEQHAGEIADEGVRLAADAGLTAEPVLLRAATATSDVWRQLVDVADERDAAVIVVGRRGKSRLERALLGSVSNGLTQHADRPLLIVPSPDDD